MISNRSKLLVELVKQKEEELNDNEVTYEDLILSVSLPLPLQVPRTDGNEISVEGFQTDGGIIITLANEDSRENNSTVADLIFDPEDQDDDIADPDYSPESSELSNENLIEENLIDGPVEDIEVQTSFAPVQPNRNIVPSNEDAKAKYKRPRTSEEKKRMNRLKHPFVMMACVCKESKCEQLISERERKNVYENYWSMNKEMQKVWLTKYVSEVRSIRKTEGSRRTFTRNYTLPVSSDPETVTVCQKIFLGTFGYKSSTVIDHLLKLCKDEHGTRLPKPRIDGRGKHVPANKKNKQLIMDHINSFKPRHSHYRREHAPNRRYLPADLTIKFMHEKFNEEYPHQKVSYEFYRLLVDAENIGFYEAEADKCGTCLELSLDETEENNLKKAMHTEEVSLRRKLYNEDGKIQKPSVKVYSADMQKVFLLPRMPKIKETFFTSRMITFNETFASMKKKDPHYCVLWNESVAGRRAEDVSSAFVKFLNRNRDASEVIIWMDNCSAQNKNWIFFSSILIYMNDAFCSINSVTLKYLLTGHTYNASDGIHGKIEQKIKKIGDVQDFDDFVLACKASTARTEVSIMGITDFYRFENILKTGGKKKNIDNPEESLPYLKDTVEVKFLKGNDSIFYKRDFRSDEYEKSSNILKRRASLKMPQRLSTMRGIKSSKKADIIKYLVSKMRIARRAFWMDLPGNDDAEDILENEGL